MHVFYYFLIKMKLHQNLFKDMQPERHCPRVKHDMQTITKITGLLKLVLKIL